MTAVILKHILSNTSGNIVKVWFFIHCIWGYYKKFSVFETIWWIIYSWKATAKWNIIWEIFRKREELKLEKMKMKVFNPRRERGMDCKLWSQNLNPFWSPPQKKNIYIYIIYIYISIYLYIYIYIYLYLSLSIDLSISIYIYIYIYINKTLPVIKERFFGYVRRFNCF